MREQWTQLTDDQLLAQCEVDTYRASGPGGQKRNKTSSAVRLRHLPSGLIVIAEESRSQHENRAKALRRMRVALSLQLREALPREMCTAENLKQHPAYQGLPGKNGRLHLGVKDVRFWPVAALILDLLHTLEGRVSETAQALGISTGNLIAFLETDPKLWQIANEIRSHYGQKPLRPS